MWIARSTSAQIKVNTILSLTNEHTSEQIDVGSEFAIELADNDREGAIVMARAGEDLIFKLKTDQSKWRMRPATDEEAEVGLALLNNRAQHWLVTSVA
jgi:hypothetical protein